MIILICQHLSVLMGSTRAVSDHRGISPVCRRTCINGEWKHPFQNNIRHPNFPFQSQGKIVTQCHVNHESCSRFTRMQTAVFHFVGITHRSVTDPFTINRRLSIFKSKHDVAFVFGSVACVIAFKHVRGIYGTPSRYGPISSDSHCYPYGKFSPP
jgi:hypothetical protein